MPYTALLPYRDDDNAPPLPLTPPLPYRTDGVTSAGGVAVAAAQVPKGKFSELGPFEGGYLQG